MKVKFVDSSTKDDLLRSAIAIAGKVEVHLKTDDNIVVKCLHPEAEVVVETSFKHALEVISSALSEGVISRRDIQIEPGLLEIYEFHVNICKFVETAIPSEFQVYTRLPEKTNIVNLLQFLPNLVYYSGRSSYVVMALTVVSVEDEISLKCVVFPISASQLGFVSLPVSPQIQPLSSDIPKGDLEKYNQKIISVLEKYNQKVIC